MSGCRLQWTRNAFTQTVAYPRGLTFQQGMDWYCRTHNLTVRYDADTKILTFKRKVRI
jgi:hypothetical protein